MQNKVVCIGIKKSAQRKVLGLSLFSFVILCLSCLTVTAGIAVISMKNNVITLSPAISFSTSMPTSFSGTAGSFYAWDWNIQSDANQPQNVSVAISLTKNGIETGDATIKLYNNTITLAETSTAYNNSINTTTTFVFPVSTSMAGNLSVNFSNTANVTGTYDLSMRILP